MPLTQLIDTFDRKELVKAQKLNNELSFYSENIQDFRQHPHYLDFRNQIKSLYRKNEKENYLLMSYMNYRVPTISIADKIYKGLKNIFDAQNQNISISVKDKNESELIAEMDEYFQYFKNEGWENLRGKFNSFLVIDIDPLTNKPYIYNVLPEFVHYYNIDNELVKEIIFSFDSEIFYYYTDTFYSVYQKTSENTYIELRKSLHGIKKCPVTVFLFEKYNSNSELLRKTPVLPVSDKLYWYTIKHAELLVSELKAANYTQVVPEKSCGYRNGELTCLGGLMYYPNPDSESGFSPKVLDDGNQEICPCCGFNKHIGVGATIAINTEAAAAANLDISNLIKFFAPPLEGTEFQKLRLKEYETEIINQTIGEVKKITYEARNEKDIISDFEDSTKILTQFGYFYAKTIEFAYDIILRIKYPNDYIVVSVFLGNKFYLLTKEELILQKEKCSNPVERADIEMKIFKLDYQHDPDKLKAISFIYENLPYAGTTDADFLELIKLGKVSDFDIELRMNINYYVSLFLNYIKNDMNKFDFTFTNKYLTKLVNDKLKLNGNDERENSRDAESSAS